MNPRSPFETCESGSVVLMGPSGGRRGVGLGRRGRAQPPAVARPILRAVVLVGLVGADLGAQLFLEAALGLCDALWAASAPPAGAARRAGPPSAAWPRAATPDGLHRWPAPRAARRRAAR